MNGFVSFSAEPGSLGLQHVFEELPLGRQRRSGEVSRQGRTRRDGVGKKEGRGQQRRVGGEANTSGVRLGCGGWVDWLRS